MMSKISRYNQVLLSVIGTLLLLFILIGGVMALVSMYQDWQRHRNYQEDGVLASERTKELLQDSMRQQLISFRDLILLDTTEEIFLLPVSQANLNDPEEIGEISKLGISNSFSRSNYHLPRKAYNNLMIYDAKSGQASALFDKRVAINSFQKIVVDTKVILQLAVTTKDSNQDGLLNDQDLQQLFIYHLSDARLVEVPSEGRDFISIDKLFPRDDFAVLFGLDKNRDGTFKRGTEPTFFYKLNLQNGSTELLVNEEDIHRLQERLDGRMQ